jgi:excisionase family DNA binding protein
MRSTEFAQIIQRLEEIERLIRSDEKPMTTTEAAEYLGVSRSYLYKATSNKSIPYYQPGGKLVYFKREDLNRFAYSKRIMSEKEIQEAASRYINSNSWTRSPIRRAR